MPTYKQIIVPPKAKTVLIDGVEQWLYLINRFKLDPKEALETMEKHGQDVASVLVYLEEILNSYTLNMKEDLVIAEENLNNTISTSMKWLKKITREEE